MPLPQQSSRPERGASAHPLNAWYAAAWDVEVGRALLPKTICGRPVVLYRTTSGSAVALADACWHRLVPLSMGALRGDDEVMCGYHGLCFGPDGRATSMPAQRTINPRAGVHSFPVVERHRFVWIWPGDPALADPALVPDMHENDDAAWAGDGKTITVECGYQLVVDNLMDLTHEEFVHGSSLAHSALSQSEAEVSHTDTTVTVTKWMLDIDPPPFWKRNLQDRFPGYTGRVDRWQIIQYWAPSTISIDVGVAKTRTGAPEGDRSQGVTGTVLNTMTPSTDRRCYYLWAFARDWSLGSQAITTRLREGVSGVFFEDEQMLEVQQRGIDANPNHDFYDLNIDAGGMWTRRIVQRMLQAETPDAPGSAWAVDDDDDDDERTAALRPPRHSTRRTRTRPTPRHSPGRQALPTASPNGEGDGLHRPAAMGQGDSGRGGAGGRRRPQDCPRARVARAGGTAGEPRRRPRPRRRPQRRAVILRRRQRRARHPAGHRRPAVTPGPRGSAYLHSLRPGSTLLASAPRQDFSLSYGPPQYALLAGGIGVTAFVAMAAELQRRGADYRLVHVARSRGRLAFADELRSRHGDRLQAHLGDEQGRFDVRALVDGLAPDAELYVCGPITLLDAAKRAWTRSRRPPARLRFESFGSSGRYAPEPFRVRVPRLALDTTVPAGSSMLEALERDGAEVMSGCRRGECGLCTVKVLGLDGALDHRDVFLSEAQQADGSRMQACVSRAVSAFTAGTASRPAEAVLTIDVP